MELLRRILEIYPDRYTLHLIDDFESDPGWKDRGSTSLAHWQMIRKTPDEEAARREQDLIRSVYPESTGLHSLFLHTSFTLPGQQTFKLCRIHTEWIEGAPRKVSLWVHSTEILHTLSLEFETRDRSRILVPLPDLDYQGWRRLEASLPVSLFAPDLRRQDYAFRFRCLVLRSSPLEKAGDLSLLLDSFLILTENNSALRPGMEQNDDW